MNCSGHHNGQAHKAASASRTRSSSGSFSVFFSFSVRFAGRYGQRPSRTAVNIAFFLNLLLPFVFRKVARADQHQNTHSERTSRPPLLYPTFVALVPNPLRHHPCGGQVFHGILAVLSTTGACRCGLCNGWVGVMGVRACVRAGGWVGGGHHGCHGSAIVICRREPHVHDHLGTDMHMHMSMRTVPSSHAMHQCMMPWLHDAYHHECIMHRFVAGC